jgi:hypothetical protein
MLLIIRNLIRSMLRNEAYDTCVLLLVVMNTILLSLNGIVDTSNMTVDYMSLLNTIFSMGFLTDVILKLIAYDFEFFEDFMNIFDLAVVVISVV